MMSVDLSAAWMRIATAQGSHPRGTLPKGSDLDMLKSFIEEVESLREENKVLKNELAAVEDALKDAIGRTKA